jgi:hypothetical protein
MTMTSTATKLQQLRSQTDHQLLELINKRLQRALAASRRVGSGATCDEVIRACKEVRRLLPVVGGLNRSDRARLESRLAELQCTLALPAAS